MKWSINNDVKGHPVCVSYVHVPLIVSCHVNCILILFACISCSYNSALSQAFGIVKRKIHRTRADVIFPDPSEENIILKELFKRKVASKIVQIDTYVSHRVKRIVKAYKTFRSHLINTSIDLVIVTSILTFLNCKNALRNPRHVKLAVPRRWTELWLTFAFPRKSKLFPVYSEWGINSEIKFDFNQRSCIGLGVKPQDMTALSIDYVITLTGGAPSGGRWHNSVNTTQKLCIIFLFFLFLLKKPKDITTFSYDSMTALTGCAPSAFIWHSNTNIIKKLC